MTVFPLSALAHYSYCPRRAGLVHLEHVWEENLFTLKGTEAHARTDAPQTRAERGKTVLRALPVWSDVLGITGTCDTVEAVAPIAPGMPPDTIYPVEYKSGKPTKTAHASIQACAQALCLEEMFETTVKKIVLYFFTSHTRVPLILTEGLRERTLQCIQDVRSLLDATLLPPPVADSRCPNCSLIDACQPFALAAAAESRYSGLFRLRAEHDFP